MATRQTHSGKPDSIIEALSLMTKQLVSSITTLNSSMNHSFTEMNETLGNLAYVSSKLTDRERSSIIYTMIYIFARGLSIVFFAP